MQLQVPLKRGGGRAVGFLKLDAPVAQISDGDGFAGNGAEHEVARLLDTELAVHVGNAGFTLETEQTFETIHHSTW